MQRPKYSQGESNVMPIAMGPMVKERKAGAQPYSVEQSGTGDVIEYNYESDLLKRPLQALAKTTSP